MTRRLAFEKKTAPKLLVAMLFLFSSIEGFAQTPKSAEKAEGSLPLYSLAVYGIDGQKFQLNNAAAYEGYLSPWPDKTGKYGDVPEEAFPKEMKYYLWIRRVGETGALTFPLPFSKIAEIQFTGVYGGEKEGPLARQGTLILDGEEQSVTIWEKNGWVYGWKGIAKPPVLTYIPARMKLVNGTEFDVLVKADGALGGVDEEFGVYVALSLQSGEIERLEFLHGKKDKP